MKLVTVPKTEFIKPQSTLRVQLYDQVFQPLAGKIYREHSQISGLKLSHQDVIITRRTSSLVALYRELEAKSRGAASQVRTLKLQNAELGSLAGIELFPGLVRLQVNSHKLTDISQLRPLRELVSLDFTGCSQLLDLRPLQKSGIVVLKLKGTICNNFSIKALLGLYRLGYLDVSDSNVDKNNDFEIINGARSSLISRECIVESLRLAEKRFMRNFLTCDYSGHYGGTHIAMDRVLIGSCHSDIIRKRFPILKTIGFREEQDSRETIKYEKKKLCTAHLKRLVRGIKIVY